MHQKTWHALLRAIESGQHRNEDNPLWLFQHPNIRNRANKAYPTKETGEEHFSNFIKKHVLEGEYRRPDPT